MSRSNLFVLHNISRSLKHRCPGGKDLAYTLRIRVIPTLNAYLTSLVKRSLLELQALENHPYHAGDEFNFSSKLGITFDLWAGF